jgi:hypothetical protein
MSNTLLTPTAVTRKALMVLHQKLNFIGTINRQYDNQFAQAGGKIGDTLKIRLPNRYVAVDGAVMQVQDTAETSVSLQVSSQKHVAMNFGAAELALSLDDFTDRIIEPAMAVLAAKVERDVISTMVKATFQQAGTAGSAVTLNAVLAAGGKLNDSLAPLTKRSLLLSTQGNIDLVDGLKGLFQDTKELSAQYRDGVMGHAAGFDILQSSLMLPFTPGSEVAAGSSTITINGSNQTGSAITVTNGSSKTLLTGDIITLPGVYRLHPETKDNTGVLHQFVVTSDVATSGTTINISPSIVLTGPTANCSAAPTTGQAIAKLGVANTAYGMNLAYHRDAFAFATADLPLPKGAEFAAREVYDGISLRIWKDRDILNDAFPARVDILYGKQAIRPQLACRIAGS